MNRFLFLFAFCFLQTIHTAKMPATQSISGQVPDKYSQNPLIGASVRIKKSHPALELKTDVDGLFSFKSVPVGRWQVTCVHKSYQPWHSDTILVDSACEIFLDIFLRKGVAYRTWVRTKSAAPAKGILYQTTDSSLILLKYNRDSRSTSDSTQEILIKDIEKIAIREKGIVGDSFAQGAEEGFESGSYESATTAFCTLIGGLIGLINSPPKIKIKIDGKQSL